MLKPKILMSMPTQNHVEIALDELTGLQQLGYNCHKFPFAAKDGYSSAFGKFWVIVSNAFNLIKISNSFKPNIIYFNSRVEVKAGVRDAITIFLVRTFYLHKVLFVIKSHGSDLEIFKTQNYFLKSIIIPYLKKRVSAWLFLSTEEQIKVNKMNYLPADKVYVTKNIVRIDQFKIDPNFRIKNNIPIDHKILLFAGRVIEEKGILDVVNAFKKLSKNEKATLIVVGDGTALEAAKASIGLIKINHKVVFTGFIPEQEVVEYYANSDILIFPTYTAEGFPMALFNSVAAGLSIITTPTRAATDYLKEPYNCLWVQPRDADGVYKALISLYKSDELMESMRINNLQKAKLFSRAKVTKELSITIESILNRKV